MRGRKSDRKRAKEAEDRLIAVSTALEAFNRIVISNQALKKG